MSRIAVESHKGDRYQNLLVAKYAAKMMDQEDDLKIVRIEIESTRVLAGNTIEVDDFIVHYETGKKTYCQCKKNQKDRKNWTIHELGGELKKAWKLFSRVDDCESITFYSQNGFGDLEKLTEEAHTYPDLKSFIQSGIENNHTISSIYKNLKKELGVEERENGKLWEFLKTLSLESPQKKDIIENICMQLSLIVTNASSAFDTILELIAQINTREKNDRVLLSSASSCYISQEVVLARFKKNGICLAPQYPMHVLQEELRRISSIGRCSFLREINCERVFREEVDTIIQYLDDGHKTILLEGGPGSGKSCVLLDFVERLEIDPDSQYGVVYLQAKEFNDIDYTGNSSTPRLDHNFIFQIARFAELRPVVVAVDSLDVIAISTGVSSFKFFTQLLDQLRDIAHVSIVACCRSFDSHYDSNLRAIPWEKRVFLKPWDWEKDIIPLFEKWGWDAHQVSNKQKDLLKSPYMLWIYHELRMLGMKPSQANDIDLLSQYFKFSLNKKMGYSSRKRIETSLYAIAQEMLNLHKMEILEDQTDLEDSDIRLLGSLHILERSGYANLRFGHQTYLDIILVKNVIRQGKSLADYAKELLPVPFVRPIIRTFFFYLRNCGAERFQQEFRGIMESNDVAFHLKRLIASSLAEIVPELNDSSLVYYLFQSNEELFFLFFKNIKQYNWFQFLREDWFINICQSHNQKWLSWFTRYAGNFYNEHPEEITTFWLDILKFSWINKGSLCGDIAIQLRDCRIVNIDKTFLLIDEIINCPNDRDYVYRSVSKILINLSWVKSEKYYDFLFSFIANGLDCIFPENLEILQTRLRCCGNHFHENHEFVEKAIESSPYLLEKCIDYILKWVSHLYKETNEETIYLDIHLSAYGDLYPSHKEFSIFVMLVRNACMKLSSQGSEWWSEKLSILMQKVDENPPLMFVVLSALLQNTEKYLSESLQILKKNLVKKRFFYTHELCQLLKNTSIFLNEEELHSIVDPVFDIYENSDEEWEKQKIISYIDVIPVPWKTEKIVLLINKAKQEGILPRFFFSADKNRISGRFRSPCVSSEVFLCLSKNEVLRVLKHFHEIDYEKDLFCMQDTHIEYQLQKAISMSPTRFSYLWKESWAALDEHIHNAVLGGLADHLHYLYGNTRTDNWNAKEYPKSLDIVKEILLLLGTTIDFNDRTVTSALEACSWVAFEKENLYQKIIHILQKYVNIIDTHLEEKKDIDMGYALNSSIGSAIQSAIILFEKRRGEQISSEHMQLLREFSLIENLSVKAFYIERMLIFLNYDKGTAWALFRNMLTDKCLYDTNGVYHFLYYCYHKNFHLVAPHLNAMLSTSTDEAGKHWGSLMALCLLDKKIPLNIFKKEILSIDKKSSWEGALSVFIENLKFNNEGKENANIIGKCLNGIQFILDSKPDLSCEEMYFIGAFNSPDIQDTSLIKLAKEILKKKPAHCVKNSTFFSWLERAIANHVDDVMELMEMVSQNTDAKDWNYFYDKELLSVITGLFREGENREISDQGHFLRRILSIIEQLHQKNVNIDDWYNNFERS